MPPDPVIVSELERTIQQASAGKRAVMAEHVTDLFIGAAGRIDEMKVALIDEILSRLIEEIEFGVQAAISRRIAPFSNAPPRVVRQFAGNSDITVAGPVLRASPRLTDDDLTGLAARMGRSHLLAIAQRERITAAVTDILVARGDAGILWAVAGNRGSRFSDPGFAALVKRAAGDDRLAEAVGLRADLPPQYLRRLIGEATDIVRRRLVAAAADPKAQPEIEAAVADAAARIAATYGEAQRTVLALVRSGKLDEAVLRAFARSGQHPHTVATLSALARVPIHVVERAARGERLDALLILGRAIGIEWRTMRAIIVWRTGRSADGATERMKLTFDRLSQSTADQVVRCWRQAGAGAVRPR